MGDYQHYAILVSGEEGYVEEARNIAVELLGDRAKRVTEMTYGANGFTYFAVLPSGGKVGGSIQREHHVALTAWKDRLAVSPVDWVEISWGEYGGALTDERRPYRKGEVASE